MKKKFVEEIEELILPILEEKGVELVDVTFQKEGKDKILRFYVDKINGRITLDECGDVNKIIGDFLDEKELIEESYILEVSSPGINRVIKKEKDFIKFKGSKIDVSLFKAINNNKRFCGILKDFKNNKVIVELNNEELEIPLEAISKANLHFDFD